VPEIVINDVVFTGSRMLELGEIVRFKFSGQ
jgi:hypothetical protein